MNHAVRPAHFAIRSHRYKLIFYYARNLDMTDTENFSFTPAWDFYDLQKDPRENHNTYNDPTYASVIKQMKKRTVAPSGRNGRYRRTIPRNATTAQEVL